MQRVMAFIEFENFNKYRPVITEQYCFFNVSYLYFKGRFMFGVLLT